MQKICTRALGTFLYAKNDSLFSAGTFTSEMSFESYGECLYHCMLDGKLCDRQVALSKHRTLNSMDVLLDW